MLLSIFVLPTLYVWPARVTNFLKREPGFEENALGVGHLLAAFPDLGRSFVSLAGK
jgi:hypothetical protein